MKSSHKRALGIAAALTIGVALATAATGASAQPSPRGDVPPKHPTGLDIVGPAPEVPELPAELSDAIGEIEKLADSNPQDFGFVWVDRKASRVVLDVVTAKGEQLAAELDARLAATPAAGRQPAVRKRGKSQLDLERVKHDAIDLGADPAFAADGIWQSEVDPESGRVILTVSSLSDSLAAELVRRYGVDGIAVRVDPDRPQMAVQGRRADRSPFWGGSKIMTLTSSGCSTGFPWYSGSYSYLLTAGHCIHAGGDVVNPVGDVGGVVPGARENWHVDKGTQAFSGETVMRGDLALVFVTSPGTSGTSVYSGAADSTESAIVGQMWSRRAQAGDKYCTSGYRTGEICGWTVSSTRVDVKYTGGETIRNAVKSNGRQGQCTLGGDSGGPVYTVRSDGKLAAKGIHSGGGGDGSWLNKCTEVFTDIYEAYYYFPGFVRTA